MVTEEAQLPRGNPLSLAGFWDPGSRGRIEYVLDQMWPPEGARYLRRAAGCSGDLAHALSPCSGDSVNLLSSISSTLLSYITAAAPPELRVAGLTLYFYKAGSDDLLLEPGCFSKALWVLRTVAIPSLFCLGGCRQPGLLKEEVDSYLHSF